MSHIKKKCELNDDLIIKHSQLVKNSVLFEDSHQVNVVKKLQDLKNDISNADSDDESYNNCIKKNGLYIYGGVGRGKTFLMDTFHSQLSTKKKMRVHFHEFMRKFHDDMKKHENDKNSLISVADEISENADVICFDEFHVSDITDAMILGRLIERFFENGVQIVITSNYHPEDLYPNGLARDRFLPTIDILTKQMEIINLGGDMDYRYNKINQTEKTYFLLQEQNKLKFIFNSLSGNSFLDSDIEINGRVFSSVCRSSDVIWFSFSQLCADAVGKGDYLELSKQFSTIILSETPKFGDDSLKEEWRRFSWLIDILYDNNITLIMSAEVNLDELYCGIISDESDRIISRLTEMQSSSYWNKKFS